MGQMAQQTGWVASNYLVEACPMNISYLTERLKANRIAEQLRSDASRSCLLVSYALVGRFVSYVARSMSVKGGDLCELTLPLISCLPACTSHKTPSNRSG